MIDYRINVFPCISLVIRHSGKDEYGQPVVHIADIILEDDSGGVSTVLVWEKYSTIVSEIISRFHLEITRTLNRVAKEEQGDGA